MNSAEPESDVVSRISTDTKIEEEIIVADAHTLEDSDDDSNKSEESRKKRESAVSGESKVSYASKPESNVSGASRTASKSRGSSRASKASRTSKSSRGSKASSRGTQIDRNPLQDLTNAELVAEVEELQKNIKYLELETTVFQNFLEQKDPAKIEGLAKGTDIKDGRSSVTMKRLTLNRHSASRRESIHIPEFNVELPGKEKEMPRINIAQKTDLVLRHIDGTKNKLKKFKSKCIAIGRTIKADLEELNIRESEISELETNFKQTLFPEDETETVTRKNPADKFVRFMQDYLRKNRTLRDKLRLRTSSLKVQFQKLSHALVHKKMLGENLQQVDFEQLQIANKHLTAKIDERNLLLLEVKKMNGHANLLLSQSKKSLLKKMLDLKDYKDSIAFQEENIVKLDEECDKVGEELEAAKNEYDKLKTKQENYQVPSVLDYVNKKVELGSMRKNLKMWSRRKQIKEMALNAFLRAVRTFQAEAAQVTKDDVSLSETLFEFDFERRERYKRSIRLAKISKRRIQHE